MARWCACALSVLAVAAFLTVATAQTAPPDATGSAAFLEDDAALALAAAPLPKTDLDDAATLRLELGKAKDESMKLKSALSDMANKMAAMSNGSNSSIGSGSDAPPAPPPPPPPPPAPATPDPEATTIKLAAQMMIPFEWIRDGHRDEFIDLIKYDIAKAMNFEAETNKDDAGGKPHLHVHYITQAEPGKLHVEIGLFPGARANMKTPKQLIDALAPASKAAEDHPTLSLPSLTKAFGKDVVATFVENRLVVPGCCDCRACSFALYKKDEETCLSTTTVKMQMLGQGKCKYRPHFLPPCNRCSSPVAKICSEKACEEQPQEVGLDEPSSSGSNSLSGSASGSGS